MKKLLLILLLTILVQPVFSQYYYYSDNRQIPLLVDSTKVMILFNDSMSYNYEQFALEYPRIDSFHIRPIFDGFIVAGINTGDSLNEFIDSLNADVRVLIANPYFIIQSDMPMLIGRTLCCKFNDNISQDFIDSINTVYDVETIGEDPYSPKSFLLQVEKNSTFTLLEIANIYYELDETIYAQPNFMGGIKYNDYFIYDHYWQEQWAMHRVFESSPALPRHKAFEITQGDTNIIVAILDQGFLPHEDIPENRFVAGYDFAHMDNDPSPCNFSGWGWHGEGVAGIVGASHNRYSELMTDPNTGIYGISPLSKIMPIRIGSGFPFPEFLDSLLWYEDYPSCFDPYFASTERIAGAINWAWGNGADILSCSWGSKYPQDVLHNAIQMAVINGRGGKGCGVFYAAGNVPTDTAYYPAMYPEVISVGALHPDDSVWGYSCYAKVDVVAPSGQSIDNPIWTTDLMGDLGYNRSISSYNCGDPNDVDYNCRFGGTSAAQPVAAGVAALLLARRPDLTHDQLHEIIKKSADPNLYITITDPPDQKYGYGMVDPLRALLAVCRGDVDNSGQINILDATYLITYLYQGGPAPEPDVVIADAKCDRAVNILDATYIIQYLYNGGPAPQVCFEYDY
ncbi:MAG: S8 family serine peptidase [Candidatus Zixiibacteriota bacterium]